MISTTARMADFFNNMAIPVFRVIFGTSTKPLKYLFFPLRADGICAIFGLMKTSWSDAD